MSQYPHERACTRLPLRLDVEIHARDVTIRCEETRDISVKGVYVVTGQRLPLGVECDVAIGPGGRNHEERFQLKGQVVRVDVSGIAVEFTEIGVDAFYQLKNLLVDSAEDPDSIESEILKTAGAEKKAG
jgi:hypothetical protein